MFFSFVVLLNERFWGCLKSHATISLLNPSPPQGVMSFGAVFACRFPRAWVSALVSAFHLCMGCRISAFLHGNLPGFTNLWFLTSRSRKPRPSPFSYPPTLAIPTSLECKAHSSAAGYVYGVHTCISLSIYMCIYIYIHRERERD